MQHFMWLMVNKARGIPAHGAKIQIWHMALMPAVPEDDCD
jgi:hypothetical protein